MVKVTALLLVCSVALAGCPDEDEAPDGTSLKDLHGNGKKDGTGKKEGGAGFDGPGGTDRGAKEGGQPAGDVGQAGDLGFNCAECLLEQVCVHFINSTNCQETKTQCKYRSPACFSPKTNPCCDCEVQVCGMWSQCQKPAACPAPTPGSFDPDRECFCYSK